MKAYKLVRLLKNGDLAPLFINKTQRLELNKWLKSECHPTKGFAVRQGWHCTLKPEAPHLTTKDRIWVEVEVKDIEYFDRPESQGGTWVLADQIRITKILKD